MLCLLLLGFGAGLGYLIGWGMVAISGVEPGYGRAGLPALWGGAAGRAGAYGAAILLAVSLAWTAVALIFGDRIVVRLAGAREVTPEEEPRLHNVVEEMAIAAGLPKPRVVVIETPALNAFAAGRRPERATIGVTRGLLERLSRSELQGVVGHEMGHIANNDILYATAVGVLVGLIVLIADIARRSVIYGSYGRRRSSRGAGGAVALVIFLVLAIVAPLAARLVQMAISRQREYMADATAVRFTRNPLGLIGALEKIAGSEVRDPSANRAIQHLFFVNPFRNFGERAAALFATHPAISLRIARLRDLG